MLKNLGAPAVGASESKATASPFTSIGGQAVMEGVMMRSPRFVVTAVRAPGGKIAIKSARHDSWLMKYPYLRKPVIRGVITLVESLAQGMESLAYSARIQADAAENESAKPSDDGGSGTVTGKAELAITFVLAFVMAIGLFVVLPHVLAWLIGVASGRPASEPVAGMWFHLLDGLFKIAILLGYVFLIGRVPEIRRVFEYHGAEHKSIYAFERGGGLQVSNARAQSTLHPRCGTSFLLFVVVISVAVFTVLLPALGVTGHLRMIAAKVLLMLPVAGLAYEAIRASAFRMDQPVFRLLIFPGLWLQRLTTRQPKDDQLEVALVSLVEALRLEKCDDESRLHLGERTVLGLDELPPTAPGVSVAEFAEA